MSQKERAARRKSTWAAEALKPPARRFAAGASWASLQQCGCLPAPIDKRAFPWKMTIGVNFSEDVKSMATITIDLDDDLARHVEEAARREHKSVSQWIKERVRPQEDRAGILATMEARALANGYPPGWLTLYASLADDDSLIAPTRGGRV